MIGVDDDGDIAVVHLEGYPAPLTVAVRALDGAGPSLTSTAPAGGVAGQPMAFAATATDHWSAIASYQWSFGDGSTATGPSLTHTYAAAGSYPVTVTATDAVGNATTRTATTTVTAPAPLLALFKLKKKRIATDEKTKLKVQLNTAATLRVVLKSKHKHVVKGKKKYVKLVLTQETPGRQVEDHHQGQETGPRHVEVVGTATNSTGSSPKARPS